MWQIACAVACHAAVWLGMRDMEVDAEFERQGGFELACMSTTTDLAVALRYSASQASLLLKLRTSSFMDRGAEALGDACKSYS